MAMSVQRLECAAGFGCQRCQGLQRDEQPLDFSCLQHHGGCEHWEGRAQPLDTLERFVLSESKANGTLG